MDFFIIRENKTNKYVRIGYGPADYSVADYTWFTETNIDKATKFESLERTEVWLEVFHEFKNKDKFSIVYFGMDYGAEDTQAFRSNNKQ